MPGLGLYSDDSVCSTWYWHTSIAPARFTARPTVRPVMSCPVTSVPGSMRTSTSHCNTPLSTKFLFGPGASVSTGTALPTGYTVHPSRRPAFPASDYYLLWITSISLRQSGYCLILLWPRLRSLKCMVRYNVVTCDIDSTLYHTVHGLRHKFICSQVIK